MGGYVAHRVYLHHYKKEFKAYISTVKEHAAFTIIHINPSEVYVNSLKITWEDENKEVVYKGILHDVVSIKGKGLTVELTLVSDHEEMKLKKDFADLYDINSGSATKSPFELLKNLLSLTYLVEDGSFRLNILTNSGTSYFMTDEFFLINRIILPDSPPPDFSV